MSDYWNGYYGSEAAPVVPSQFAVFVANEFPGRAPILEVGCGNGRDSFYLASVGYPVVGIDASTQAIELCRAQAKPGGPQFCAGPADDATVWREAEGLLAESAEPALVYARFFFHAIDDTAQAAVLDHATGFLARRGGGVLCAEFRTPHDRALAKVYGDHYRRFIEPGEFAAALEERGFAVTYRVEGQGFAKYREDDAYVARIVARR